MAVFCTQCGSGLPNSARFCSYCGSTVQLPPPFPGRPLVRPIYGRQVAGVCLGLAQANGWDVAVIRIIAVLGLFFSSGLVGVAYLAGWLGIPDEIPAPVIFRHSRIRRATRRLLIQQRAIRRRRLPQFRCNVEGMIQHFVSDGARFRFFDAGAGRPVVFLHPTPLTMPIGYPSLPG